jgi:hypothetical protein
MNPLVKNIGLAFLAGFVSSLAAFAAANPTVPSKDVALAAGTAAVYAGVRGAIGYAKARVTGVPFDVDTEAPEPTAE